MSRRSPNPTSCAATASAHVGQGHPTRIEDVLRMRSGRPPPLTRRPLPCRALVEAAQHVRRTTSPERARYARVAGRLGPAKLTIARPIARQAFQLLRTLELA